MKIELNGEGARFDVGNSGSYEILFWDSVPDRAVIRVYIDGRAVPITMKQLKAMIKTFKDII